VEVFNCTLAFVYIVDSVAALRLQADLPLNYIGTFGSFRHRGMVNCYLERMESLFGVLF